jgi:hypothetical protein
MELSRFFSSNVTSFPVWKCACERKSKGYVRLNWAAGMQKLELRKARRYALSLPVTIQVSQTQAVSRNGRTQDISTRGVYFVIEDELKPGMEPDLTISIPNEITARGEVSIHIAGKVMRVEDRSGDGIRRFSVAAVIGDYEIARSITTDAKETRRFHSLCGTWAVGNFNS